MSASRQRPQAESAAGAELLPATRAWVVDPLHSSVRFAVRHHAVATYRAGFAEFEARYDGEARTLAGSVDVGSVQVAFTALYEELMSEVFFDVARYPVISFSSSAIDADGDALTIVGDMTMKGVTKAVEATGTVSATTSLVDHYDGTAHEHFGVDLELAIDRREFGVDHNNTLLDGRLNLGWDVQIQFALEFSTLVGPTSSPA